ncbi:L-2-hydroxyglutarate oxidase [Planctobacterium marinum]|uniref:L-2-hydroxyglutarate oxidase n=1 Tax=Planctobacterium marinum TaxID=1631968 RepID=UPI001E58ECC9|nr:L-2-hydroxyglutarate oxidase [Planctobacterium marinum]MCC2607545.1 L-2-hydroxyglutarate oxidase [Planctobacterium marinum]
MSDYDIIVIGGGIVGAASALKIKREKPGLSVLLLEKEAAAAQHQTGRNSGVIHAGVYYAPDSLKAKYCREGLQRTIAWCQQYDLPYQQCGKLIVATDEQEEARLQQLYLRCQQNQLQPELLSAAQLRAKAPAISGSAAMFIQQTGITDYKRLTAHFLAQFEQLGGKVRFNTQVDQLEENEHKVRVVCKSEQFSAAQVLNCAGVYSDELIRQLKPDIDWRIIPFKGEYFRLPEKYNRIVEHLIYPVPDPQLPFLGVHLTLMIGGYVTVGPNAVLALGKEAYGKTELQFHQFVDMLCYSGFRQVVKKNWRSGMEEFRNSLNKRGYLKLVQKYCPQIQLQDLLPYPAGIRAQAVSDNGELIHDFRFAETARSLHVGNAPSPAATSALPIADAIYSKLADKL